MSPSFPKSHAKLSETKLLRGFFRVPGPQLRESRETTQFALFRLFESRTADSNPVTHRRAASLVWSRFGGRITLLVVFHSVACRQSACGSSGA